MTFKIAYCKFIVIAATDRTSNEPNTFNHLFTVESLEEAEHRLIILSRNLYQDEYACIFIFDNEGVNYYGEKIQGLLSLP